MYLIAGLGNPGPKYRTTRHNIGFQVINSWRKSLGVRFTRKRFNTRFSLITFQGKNVILARPLTFMNRSGISIKAFADYYGIKTKEILVIHDDLDLPVGRIKVTGSGGAGGHNGVSSVIQYLGSNKFPRIKVGVGRPNFGETVEDFVLSPFYHEEKIIIEDIIKIGVQACKLFMNNGIERAMNQINCQNLSNKEV